MDEALPLTMTSTIGLYPVKVPMIDIHTVGAGGGSIARADAGGALTVGPESAGADPGPVCYGKGEAITVTDANLFLGRLVPEHFLGGGMTLDTDRLDVYMGKLSSSLGLSRKETAEGVLAVANTAMERAIRVISVERGFDPGEFTLFSFGGAGGMHAAFLARLLNIPRVLVPRHPGILSAFGMLTSDVIKDYSRTVMLRNQPDTAALSRLFTTLAEEGKSGLQAEGIPPERIALERALDMRYAGQSYELMVPFENRVYDAFHRLHEKRYGYANPGIPVEVVNIRVRARGTRHKPEFEKIESVSDASCHEAVLGYRETIFEGKGWETALLSRDLLKGGQEVKGPALVLEYSSTIVIPPFAAGRVDAYGNIEMNIRLDGMA
jgi:N-methylhydantoinase A